MDQMKYMTIDMVCERYPFTEGQLRHLLIFRHRNGLESAIVKIGKRLYFDVAAFDQWIDSHKKR